MLSISSLSASLHCLRPKYSVPPEANRLEAQYVAMMLTNQDAADQNTPSMQAQEFVQISTRFLEKLKTTGPGVPGTALPQGLTLLTEFQVGPYPHALATEVGLYLLNNLYALPCSQDLARWTKSSCNLNICISYIYVCRP